MSPEDKIKVLIADGHSAVRKGIKEILLESNAIAVTGEAASGTEMLQMISKERFNVVLLDLSMPGGGGLEMVQAARKINPQVAVLVLSSYPEAMYSEKTVQAGASGYLVKSTAPEHLIDTIKRIARKDRYRQELK